MTNIPAEMQAVICYGPGDYRFETRSVPSPASGEVLVRVVATGICAGDVKCFGGAPMFWGDENRPAYCETDVVPGHEFVGQVVALGRGADEKYQLKIGDHVVSEQIVPCGECGFCGRDITGCVSPTIFMGFIVPPRGHGRSICSIPPRHQLSPA